MTSCDKCGSKSLYQDQDFVNGVCDIVCRICGKRWPVGADPETVKRLMVAREDNDLRALNIKLGIEEEEIKMAKRGPCKNCGREMQIAGDGCCATCYNAGRGLEGEAKAAALAAVKAKVDNGLLKRRGPAPAVAVVKPKVEGTAKKDPASGAIAAGSPLGKSQKVEGLAAALAAVRAEGASPEATVLLVFSEARDQALYSVLLDESVRCRRTVDQQVFWMLEHELINERALNEVDQSVSIAAVLPRQLRRENS